MANSRDTKYAGDGDLINPGKTEYDYALFAVPVSQAPVGIYYTDYGVLTQVAGRP